jgi:hypothetical protein
MTEEEGTPIEPTEGEQSGHHRDPPGREAEDVSRSDSEEVPGNDSPQTEEEVRARIEEQIRNLRVQDLMVESVVSVLNLTARRIAKEDERDLEQARVGIDAVAALADHLEEEAAGEVKNALAQIRVLYARAAEEAGEGQGEPPASGGGAPGAGPAPGAPDAGGQRKPPPGLWTPGSG